MKYLAISLLLGLQIKTYASCPSQADQKKQSDWQAQGLIELIHNNPTTIPGCLFEDKDLCKSKNLAKFMFKVVKWEKGRCKKMTIPYTVTFCSQSVPQDRSKVYRLYGKCLGTNIDQDVFYYEPIQK